MSERRPKFNKITGKAKICALNVIVKPSRIPRVSGKNEKNFLIFSPVNISPKVARKESWKPTSYKSTLGFIKTITNAESSNAFNTCDCLPSHKARTEIMPMIEARTTAGDAPTNKVKIITKTIIIGTFNFLDDFEKNDETKNIINEIL